MSDCGHMSRKFARAINAHHVNEFFLPGDAIPASVRATNDLAEALHGAAIVVSVMPSHHTRHLFKAMGAHLGEAMLFVSATKGIENESFLRMTEVIAATVPFPVRIGALSGPSFAKEVAEGHPTAITIASKDRELAHSVQREFSDPGFRLYTNDDVVGVELGGALKNIVAIAAGVCDGLNLGHNSVAALITRGLAEITRLVVACGGRPGRCHRWSRRLWAIWCSPAPEACRAISSVGVALGKGQKLDAIISGMHGMVAEGVLTTNAAIGTAAHKMRVEMPITEQMHAILQQGKSPKEAIRELMTRPSTQ